MHMLCARETCRYHARWTGEHCGSFRRRKQINEMQNLLADWVVTAKYMLTTQSRIGYSNITIRLCAEVPVSEVPDPGQQVELFVNPRVQSRRDDLHLKNTQI